MSAIGLIIVSEILPHPTLTTILDTHFAPIANVCTIITVLGTAVT